MGTCTTTLDTSTLLHGLCIRCYGVSLSKPLIVHYGLYALPTPTLLNVAISHFDSAKTTLPAILGLVESFSSQSDRSFSAYIIVSETQFMSFVFPV